MKPAKSNLLRSIPSIDSLLRELGDTGLPRPLLAAVVRNEVAAHRAQVKKKSRPGTPVHERIRRAVDSLSRTRLQPVINGTGVILHTNFGRAPLGEALVSDLSRVAWNYNNLEFDLTEGARGARAAYLEAALAVLCGAEAATVVNNCAAALVLVLSDLASCPPRREVIVSRGELVQIGGGFRIPEILEASGAVLCEVGTTNKTSLRDYSRAISKASALILKVHRSNFFMGGFVESPDAASIAALARKARIPFVEDLGSGATFDTRSITPSADREPTPAEVLRQGADLVTFSGDKLLGGPQAGVIAGRRRSVESLKRHPFFRALRCDKLILFALERTVDLHLSGRHDQIPILAMMRVHVDELRGRGSRIIEQLRDLPINVSLGQCQSQAGGGSLPGASIPSIALELSPKRSSLELLAKRLRDGSPAVIGAIAGRKLRIDLRTVFPDQDSRLAERIMEAGSGEA